MIQQLDTSTNKYVQIRSHREILKISPLFLHKNLLHGVCGAEGRETSLNVSRRVLHTPNVQFEYHLRLVMSESLNNSWYFSDTTF